jgi:hypothetical protein
LEPPVLEALGPEEFFRVIMMIRKKVSVSLQRDYFCIATSVNWV